MNEQQLLPLQEMLGVALASLHAAEPISHPGHAATLRAVIDVLTDCFEELKGPRVRYRRFAQGIVTEMITGRLIGAFGTDSSVVILGENDGKFYERATGESCDMFSWSLERLDEEGT